MHVRKNNLSKVLALIFAALIFGCSLWSSSFSLTKADSPNPYPFDQTNVLEDLETSEDFNLFEYVWDYTGLYKTACVQNFVEWCYSPFKTDSFALYVYFYNPANLQIDTDNPSNRIQMASAYDKTPITKDSTPTNYDTYNLVFCNMSTRQNYEGMFYKFRVIDKKGADGLTIAERVYSGERRYDVSGLVLATEDGAVREIGVGGTYFFTGYAAGYGPNENAESTLKCTGFQPLETISLEVHNTLYRQAGYSELGDGHRWDINSVYFSVPEKYFTDYGALQKIKAEWWEYETEPILASTNADAIAAFNAYLGKNIGEETEDLQYRIFNVETTGTSGSGVSSKQHYSGYTYNLQVNEGAFTIKTDTFKQIETLHYAFHTDSLTDSIIVSPNRLTTYIKNYNKSTVKGYLPVLIDGQKISADLFKTDLSAERAAIPYTGNNAHHKSVEIDANDKIDFKTYNPVGDSLWSKLWVGLFGREELAVVKDRTPIHTNVKDYIDLSDKAISDALLISPLAEDMDDFRNFYNIAKEKNERTVVFNFAQTDYYEEKQTLIKKGAIKGESCLVSTQSVFLDFKIIHLTFQADGSYTVIPVTQNPINIINGVSGGAQHVPTDWEKGMENFFKTIGSTGIYLLYAVVVIIVIVILVKVVPYIKRICGGKVWLFILLTILLIAACLIAMAYLGSWLFSVIGSLGAL